VEGIGGERWEGKGQEGRAGQGREVLWSPKNPKNRPWIRHNNNMTVV